MLRLIAENVSCTRGGRIVFEGLSFSVASGEAALITGRNGAGKSSLLRLIAGLVSVSQGRLSLEGTDASAPIQGHCHYAGHADALKGALSVVENLDFWRNLYGAPWYATHKALARLAIDHLADLPAAYLSAGQRRRLALARLFVSHRPIWLLDEPTSALDVTTQGMFAEAMSDHLADGGMILAATHADIGIPGTQVITIGAETEPEHDSNSAEAI